MRDASRVEAFSDGVLAIAITLLVLDLHVPAQEGDEAKRGLAHALADQWPSYLAYLVSFLVIGIMWVNHHTLFQLVRRVDRPTLFANLFLLLTISVLPFPTRLFADYLRDGDQAHVAAAVYSASMLLVGLAFALLFRVVSRDPTLMTVPMDPVTRRNTSLRFGVGNIVYAALIGLSFFNAVLTLVLHGVIALYYCFDQLAVRSPAEES
jgi:uncharacterized membrane protein